MNSRGSEKGVHSLVRLSCMQRPIATHCHTSSLKWRVWLGLMGGMLSTAIMHFRQAPLIFMNTRTEDLYAAVREVEAFCFRRSP